MNFNDRLNRENFEADLASLKALYKYVVERGEYEGTMKEWIDYAAQTLNSREIAKKLEEMEKEK